MLLIWRVVKPHSDEDEEDEQGPDDLYQELKLQWVTHTHTQRRAEIQRVAGEQEVVPPCDQETLART